LPGVMSPRRSIPLIVLRLADRGRISSLSFNRRRTGLPPSESVSSSYPSWMCESKSCSASVSFGGRLAAFFFAILHVHLRRSSSPIPLFEAVGTRLGNRRHTAATAETTGCWRACHRAFHSQPRGRLRSAVSCRAPRRCAPAARFQQCSVLRPSAHQYS